MAIDGKDFVGYSRVSGKHERGKKMKGTHTVKLCNGPRNGDEVSVKDEDIADGKAIWIFVDDGGKEEGPVGLGPSYRYEYVGYNATSGRYLYEYVGWSEPNA